VLKETQLLVQRRAIAGLDYLRRTCGWGFFRLAIPLETWGLLRSLLNFSAAASLQDWRATGNGLQALAFAYLTFGS